MSKQKPTITELKKNASSAASALGKIGGRMTAKRGKDYMRKIGRAGSKKRWANTKNKGRNIKN